MQKSIEYTITSNDPNDYSTLRCCLQQPIGSYCNFTVTNLTTKCSIVVLEKGDWIKINDVIYYNQTEYTDLSSVTVCEVLNTLIADSGVQTENDSCYRIVFTSNSNFVINDASYNFKQLLGLYDTVLPVSSVNNEYTASSIGNYISTPILYLVSNIGTACYRNYEVNYQNQKILMRINNTFSSNFPITNSNGDFTTMIKNNDLSNVELTLVDANLHKIHLLSPIYISAVAVSVDSIETEGADASLIAAVSGSADGTATDSSS